ncbi:MAG: hypothetical protein PVI70_17005, partial [Gammaproteobacteria bacterium]
MNARVTKLDRRPFAALTDDYILDLAKSIRKSFPPSVIVGFVGFLSRKFLSASDILEITILRDYFRAPFRIAHIPGFMKLPNGFLCRMHSFVTALDLFRD